MNGRISALPSSFFLHFGLFLVLYDRCPGRGSAGGDSASPRVGISLEPVPAGILALTLNVGAYLSESIRGVITGVPGGQWLVAFSLGMRPAQTLRYIIGPQALRIAVPSLSNSLTSLIKDTSLVSVITVTELLRSTRELIASTYEPLPLYLAAAAIYWVLSTGLEQVQHALERRLAFYGQTN
jgi:cystine transport system permease protein